MKTWFGRWCLDDYPGNPLGLQYGGPSKTLTHHHLDLYPDNAAQFLNKCSERISEIEPAFAVKMEELRAKFGAGDRLAPCFAQDSRSRA